MTNFTGCCEHMCYLAQFSLLFDPWSLCSIVKQTFTFGLPAELALGDKLTGVPGKLSSITKCNGSPSNETSCSRLSDVTILLLFAITESISSCSGKDVRTPRSKKIHRWITPLHASLKTRSSGIFGTANPQTQPTYNHKINFLRISHAINNKLSSKDNEPQP